MLDGLGVLVPIFLPGVGAAAVETVERRQPIEPPALGRGKRGVGGAHVGHAGPATRRRDLHAVQDRRRRRTLAIRVVGVPLLGGLLAVVVPDQPDEREVRHVVLRVMLLHRRAEHRRGGEILRRRQRLIAKYQRQVVGQGA